MIYICDFDDIDTIKWVDVIDADYQRRVHLYRFSCGNLDCTIRYSFHQTAPQIRWSCQNHVSMNVHLVMT